jgi:class 3 adenylate cyclase/HAMP domain-containing protein
MENARRDWLRRGGLFAKYVVSFVGLVVFVLAVNVALETWSMYRETTVAVANSESEKAEATAHRIDQFLEEIERQISWVTRASVTTLDQRRADYIQTLQRTPAVDELVMLDSQGREQLRVSRFDVAVNRGADYSREPWFVHATVQGSWWSPVSFRGDQPYVTFAMAHPGRNAGVTAAELNLRFLSDFVNARDVGKVGYAYLVGPQGRLLASSDTALRVGTDLSGLSQVAAMATSGAKPAPIGEDLSGRKVLVGAAAIPSVNLFAFFEQPLNQAIAPIYSFLVRIGGLLALSLAVAIAAGVLLARRMVVPIRQLQSGARRLAANEFDHRIEVQTKDEIEDLADQFNRMAGELHESYSRLEQKVDERTRDLAQSVRELQGLEEIGRAISSSLDLNAVLSTIVARAVEITGADAGAIFSYDRARGVFELAEASGLDHSSVEAIKAVPIASDDPVFGHAASEREAISIPDVASSADYPLRAAALAAGFNSVLVVPLVGQEEVLGALILQRKTAGEFPPSTIGLMHTLAHQSVLAMSNARLFREVDRRGHALAEAHDTVQSQAEKLKEQTEQLLSWNRLLEDRVATQLTEIERISRLQRFLAPQVAQLIASSDGHESLLASHRREVTVVFCDLRGFTAFTESAEPEEVMAVLRQYHAALGEIVYRYEGTLERFAGDGILVLFNDPIPYPDHAERAVRMAVDMRGTIGKLTENWRHRGHFLGFGIGIAVGYATLGQVGFDRRLEYAAVGSVTNLASRLCDEAAAGQIIISQRAFAMVEPWVEASPISPLTLKGFSRPIPALEILAWRDHPKEVSGPAPVATAAVAGRA